MSKLQNDILEMIQRMNLSNRRWDLSGYEEWLELLMELKEDSYCKFHGRLIRNSAKLIGVRTPVLHKIAAEIVKGRPEEFLNVIGYTYYEEGVLAGFVIGAAREKQIPFKRKLEWLDVLLPHMDNWAVCDLTASSFKACKEHREEVLPWLDGYLSEGKEFEVRFAIVLLMDYFLVEEYEEGVFNRLSRIKREEYYINMAIAWCYSVCFFRFHDRTVRLLEHQREVLKKQKKEEKNNSSCVFIYQSTLAKISESLRATAKDKEWIRRMCL